jgi:DNA-binding transcriptional ArsR family regulator
VEVLAHPLRARILTILAHDWASASELAAELGAPPRTVRHHLHLLRERGFVSVRSAERRRNVDEYRFSSSTFGAVDEELFTELSPAERRAVINHTLRLISGGVNRFVAAASTYDEHFPVSSRVRLAADAQAWGELLAVLDSALDQIVAIKARAAERLAAGGEEGFEGEVGLLAFEAPAAEEPPAAIGRRGSSNRGKSTEARR